MSALSALAALPMAGEFSLGVYLIVKGFKPSPITARMVAADTRGPPTRTPSPSRRNRARCSHHLTSMSSCSTSPSAVGLELYQSNQLEEAMSHPVPATLYRIAAAAGCGSAAVLLINAAKRAEVIPTSAFTQLIAPVAQILALALVTALYFAFGRRTGIFGLVAYLLNAFALSALVGVEFVINLVFRDLQAETVAALRDGSLGIALTAASILFLLGTLAFVTAMLRTREVPAAPLVLYAIGAVPISLRAFVPEAVLDLGLAVLAVGVAWLGIWLFNRSNRIATWTVNARPAYRDAAV